MTAIVLLVKNLGLLDFLAGIYEKQALYHYCLYVRILILENVLTEVV